MTIRLLVRVVKLIVSGLVFCISSLLDALRTIVGRPRSRGGVVVYYHSVRRQHRALFARQMDALLRSGKPISAARKEPCPFGERCVAITFDDGLTSIVENALPELEKRRIPATIFIVTESLGKFPIWMSLGSESPERDKVISLEQLRSLPADLVKIGSHSLTHPRLTKLTEFEARKEISDSRIKLQRMLNREITLFSFPYGAFNEGLVQICREAGYNRVFTTLPKPAFVEAEEFVSGRVVVEPTDWPLEFYLKIRGHYGWLPAAFALKRKLKFRRKGTQGSPERSRISDPM